MSVGPRAEKFNVVSNDNGRTQKCDLLDKLNIKKKFVGLS